MLDARDRAVRKTNMPPNFKSSQSREKAEI